VAVRKDTSPPALDEKRMTLTSFESAGAPQDGVVRSTR